MNRPLRVGLIAAALAVIIAGTLPLGLASRVPAWVRIGLTADDAVGTPWHGVLRNARWNGQPLGDVRVGLQPLPMLLGRIRLQLSTPTFAGVAEHGARQGFEAANGQLAYPLPLLPGTQAWLEMREAGLLFANGQCLRAGGQVRLLVQMAGPDVPQLQLAGTPACKGAEGQLVLASDPGAAFDVQVHASIGQDGHYSVSTRVRSEDPAARLALQLAGFDPGPEGLVRLDSGRAGQPPAP